ncbi:MAG: discoidin domain-containing protein [Clostridiales bacterium]|nr:discoidin domain-containing protein [Clostridiales bacterium]
MKKIISAICAASILATCMSGMVLTSASAADTLYVLSGNTFTSDDITAYESLGVTLNSADTEAVYSWSADSDSEIRQYDRHDSRRNGGYAKADYFGQAMTSGMVNSEYTDDFTWTSWDSGALNTAHFDLNGVYSVSGVDVWSISKGDENWFLGDVEIWAGETEADMKQVAAVTAQTSLTAEQIASEAKIPERTPIEFGAVKARYIDIKLKKANGAHKVAPAEFVIFGTVPGNGTTGVEVEKTKAKAEKYLSLGAFYTADSIATLQSAYDRLCTIDYTNDAYAQVMNTQAVNAINSLVPSSVHYTLSGNTWVDDDTASFYSKWDPSMTLVNASNMPSYKWNSDGDSELISNDSDNTKMTSGSINNGTLGTSTSWDSHTPNIAVFDLGSEYIVDRADIVHDRMTQNYLGFYKLGYAAVYLSSDGVVYKKAAAKAADETSDLIASADSLHLYQLETVSFAPQTARYVAVELVSGSSQVRPAQIAVFGYEKLTQSVIEAAAAADKYLDVSYCYTQASADALRNARSAADTITESSSAAEMSAVITAINDAIANLVLVNERLIYSGNAWNDSDLSVYQTYDPTITELKNASNNVTYSYPDDSNVDRDANGNILYDPNSIKLKAGALNSVSGEHTITTGWTSGGPGITVWNLGTTAVVDRVDVFTVTEKGNWRQAKDVTVSYSTDGINFTTIKTVDASDSQPDATTQVTDMTSVQFAPVKANYIKVSISEANNLVQMSEIVIFGINADYSGLQSAIEKYDIDSTLEAYATPETLAVLKTKLDAGKAMLEAQTGTNAEITALADEITAAFNALNYNGNYGILTNNLIETFDCEQYPGMSNLSTGLTYQITSTDSSTEIVGNDAAKGGILLTGGLLLAKDGDHVVAGRWDGDAVVSVTADAMHEVYFTGADLYEWEFGYASVANVVVSVSDDGVNFTEIAAIGSPKGVYYKSGDNAGQPVSLDGGTLKNFASSFKPVKGRYLRFTATKSSNQMVLAEIVIKGFIPQAVPESTLTFGTINYVTAPATADGSLTGAKTVVANGTVTNNTAADVTADIVTAIYNADGTLNAVKKVTVTVPANGDQTWNNMFSGLSALPEGAFIKNFAWDSNMTPLTDFQAK